MANGRRSMLGLKSWSSLLLEHFRAPACAFCFNAYASKLCKRCGVTFYCNASCQRAGARSHRSECLKAELRRPDPWRYRGRPWAQYELASAMQRVAVCHAAQPTLFAASTRLPKPDMAAQCSSWATVTRRVSALIAILRPLRHGMSALRMKVFREEVTHLRNVTNAIVEKRTSRRCLTSTSSRPTRSAVWHPLLRLTSVTWLCILKTADGTSVGATLHAAKPPLESASGVACALSPSTRIDAQSHCAHCAVPFVLDKYDTIYCSQCMAVCCSNACAYYRSRLLTCAASQRRLRFQRIEASMLHSAYDSATSSESGPTIMTYAIARYYACLPRHERDLAAALRWYRLAASRGHAGALFHLGICYDKGRGVAVDAVAAASLFRSAAEAGDARAQCRLGICYERGQGVLRDYGAARHWYAKARAHVRLLKLASLQSAAPAAPIVSRDPSAACIKQRPRLRGATALSSSVRRKHWWHRRGARIFRE